MPSTEGGAEHAGTVLHQLKSLLGARPPPRRGNFIHSSKGSSPEAADLEVGIQRSFPRVPPRAGQYQGPCRQNSLYVGFSSSHPPSLPDNKHRSFVRSNGSPAFPENRFGKGAAQIL